MTHKFDSYQHVSGVTKRALQTWAKNEPEREIPWTALDKPLAECKVALVSSGAMAMNGDALYDQQGEMDNPWWGDPTYRHIPKNATTEDVTMCHLHVNLWYSQQDLNCVLPLSALVDFEKEGKIGQVADTHYTYMGYNPQPKKLLEETVPQMIADMKAEGVDVVVLVPV